MPKLWDWCFPALKLESKTPERVLLLARMCCVDPDLPIPKIKELLNVCNNKLLDPSDEAMDFMDQLKDRLAEERALDASEVLINVRSKDKRPS